jgi:hypothetical protein
MSEHDHGQSQQSTDDFVPGMPKQIGRFEIRKVLGNGTFGRVLLGYDPMVRREVAIKHPFGAGLTPDMLAGFLKEAWATAEIHHANVCPIYEAGTEGNLPYLVMKYVKGGSLADLLKRLDAPMSPRHACAIAQKLALGLAAAHAKKVIHRDLKPANILYDEDTREVLIADFGLVQFADQASSGGVKGTAAYMSPEQWSPNKPWPVEARSDIYSLGIILFQLLTGKVPFSGTVYELMFQHCETPPPVPSSLSAEVDPQLDAIVLKAIAKTPAERFASAQAFAAALTEYLRATGKPDEVLADLSTAAFPPATSQTSGAAYGLLGTELPSTKPESEQLCCPNCQTCVTVIRGTTDLVSCVHCASRFSVAAGREAALRRAVVPLRPPVTRMPVPSSAMLFVTREEWRPAARALRWATFGLVLSVGFLIANAVIGLAMEKKALEETVYRVIAITAGVGLILSLIVLAVGRGGCARLPPGVPGRSAAWLSSVAAWFVVPLVGAYFFYAGTLHATVAITLAMLCLLASEFAFNRYLIAIGQYFGAHFPRSLTRIAKMYLLIALGSTVAGVIVSLTWEHAHGQKFEQAVLVLLAGVSGCLGFVCIPICFITSVWLSIAATFAVARHVRGEGK